jgi:hypothetical protein
VVVRLRDLKLKDNKPPNYLMIPQYVELDEFWMGVGLNSF